MVSSFAIHYGNEKTRSSCCACIPTSAPGRRAAALRAGPGGDAQRRGDVREHVAGVDVIDLNMGCPVPKVCKTGAGAALLKDPDTAVAVARAAAEGSGLPVTVKLRSGQRPGETTATTSRTASSRRPASPRSPSTRAAPPSITRACRTTTSRRARRDAAGAGDPHRRPEPPRPSRRPTSAPAPTP